MKPLFIILLLPFCISCDLPRQERTPETPNPEESEFTEDVNLLAGSVFLVGFEGASPKDPGVIMAKKALLEGRAAGVVFLGRNLPVRGDKDYKKKVLELTSYLREGVSPPPIIAVDQEGGVVERLKPTDKRLPSFRSIGETEDDKKARAKAFEAGREAALQLKELGFNLNFSPVVDLYRPKDSMPTPPDALTKEMALKLDKRSFGENPRRTAMLGAEVIWGHLVEGVFPCAKHFPGHGITPTDTHYALPEVDIPLEFLLEYELVPFITAISNGAPAIMTSHIINRSLDAELPATLSRAVLTGLLRRRLGFRGVIITDDMTMDAIRNMPGGNARAAISALDAGADLLIFAWRPEDWPKAYEAVRFGIAVGELSKAALIVNQRRMNSLLRRE